MRRTLGWGVIAGFVMWLVAGCALLDVELGGDDEPGGPRDWSSCDVNGDRCLCRQLEPGWQGSRGSVWSCGGFNCCLLSEGASESVSMSCECFDAPGSCEAEAASRQGSMIVTSCPPEGEHVAGAPTECADEGENCQRSYLASQALSGCCEGTVCRANVDQVRVCQRASANEIALAHVCERGAAQVSVMSGVEITQGSVSTSAGDFAFDQVQFAFAHGASGGCLNSIDMTIQGVGSSLCSLELRARMHGGAWQVEHVSGSIAGCDGFVSPGVFASGLIIASDPAEIGFGFSFEGLSCDGRSADSYCVAGVFDWQLTGTIDGVAFNDSDLVAEGVVCFGGSPEGTCTDG